MQLTATCTLILEVHKAAYLHVCILVKILLHEIHTQRILCLLGKVDFFWMRVNRNASIALTSHRSYP